MLERSDWSKATRKVVNGNKDVSVKATNPITSKKETFTDRVTKYEERFITPNSPKDDLEPLSESGGDQDSSPTEPEDQQW